MTLSIQGRLALVLGTLVVVSVVAQAAMMVVEENESTDLIRGERYRVSSDLHVTSSQIDVVPESDEARGTPTDPVELSPKRPAATTELKQDHWMYTVVLEEDLADSAVSGELEVELLLSGGGMENEPMGSVYVSQHDPSPDLVEGATITWDLGTELPENPLFVVKTHPHTSPDDGVEFTLESAWDPVDGYVWEGVGGDIDGETNPDLEVEPGTSVTFTIRHGCGDQDTAPHNFRLENSAGEVVAESDDVDECGDEDTVTWTAPESEATFDYYCQYHPDSMEAILEVTEDADGGDGGASLLGETATATRDAAGWTPP